MVADRPLAESLPRQATHLDLTDANVVVARGVRCSRTPRRRHRLRRPVAQLGGLRVGDHGVVGARASRHRPDFDPRRGPGVSRNPPVDRRRGGGAVADAGAAHRGADRQRAQQAALDPDNAYVTEQTDGEIRMFEQATSLPIDVMTSLIKAELGLADDQDAVAVDTRLIDGLDPAKVATLDLSVAVRRLRLGVRARRLAPARHRERTRKGGSRSRRRLGRHPVRPTAAEPGRAAEPGQPRCGGDGHQPVARGDRRAVAPWDGEVVDRRDDTRHDPRSRTRADACRCHAGTGPRAPGCGPGTRSRDAAAGRWAELSVRPVGAPPAPQLASAELAKGWLALTRDPRRLLGLPAMPHARPRR